MAGAETFVMGAKGLASISKLRDPTIIEQLL
jgi:hypothetical protein